MKIQTIIDRTNTNRTRTQVTLEACTDGVVLGVVRGMTEMDVHISAEETKKLIKALQASLKA